MDAFVSKETISEELGISLSTVNNWIKTQVIPAPDNQNCYTQSSFEYIINIVKGDQLRLNSRANRTFLRKKTLCCLGITSKDRKRLLSNLVNDFEISGLSVDEGLWARSFAILRSNKLTDINRKLNENSKIDILLS